MDGNNWRPTQGEPSMDGGDWRIHLMPDSRSRIVNKIMETLKRHLPISGPEGLGELMKIARRFEEKIYTAATSQPDYLRKISLKMLTMETKSPGGVGNPLSSNNGGNQNPPDSATQSLPQQVRNSPGQQLPIPLSNQSQSRQPLLTQNLQNAIASAAAQSSSGLQSSLSSVTGLTQPAMSNVVGQNSNLQTMPGMSQNSINSSVGQGVQSNMFPNSQRQMQGRQHPQQIGPQQHQQSQNSQQFYPHHMLKQKLQQGNMQSSLLQSHMQQQQPPLLQPNQIQPSQQSIMQISSGLQSSQAALQQMQPSIMQTASQSGLQQNHLQQNQQSSVQQTGQSGLQQHAQSVLRQQQQSQQPSVHQQTSVLHQQPSQINQQPMVLSQQQQLMAQQPSGTNMQQNQLLAQQNNVPDTQQQLLLGQQNNFSNMQQQQLLSQQNKNLHQSQQLGPQSNGVSNMQQQLIASQPGPGVSNMQQHQHSVNMLQQTKVAAQQQQQQQQTSTLLPSQGQQSQSQPSQQLTSQSQPSQLQQQLGMQQQPNTLQREMHQRMQSSGALLQSQNASEQQKQMFQPQRALPEASSTSMDSTAQTGHVGAVDWQEEVYQKSSHLRPRYLSCVIEVSEGLMVFYCNSGRIQIKSMKEMYLLELTELYQKIAMKCQQHEPLVGQPKQADPIEKLKFFKNMLERMISFLQVPKSNISPIYKEKLAQYEKQIIGFLSSNRLKKPAILQQPGQQHPQQSVGQSHSMTQQPQSQVTQLQQHDNLVNSMQPINMQGSVTSMQSTAVTNLQHGSMPLSAHMGVQGTQQNMMNAMQTSSNLETGPGHAMDSLPQGVVGSLQQNGVGPLQQNAINASQQTNISALSQNNMNQLQPNVSSLQTNSSILQPQHLKQQQQAEQQLMQSQLKHQYQQRQILQMKQQLMQQQPQPQLQQQFPQQQLHPQQKQQQPSQLQSQQMQQIHQMSEMSEMKVRPGAGVKPGLFPQTHLVGQRPTPYHQQLKTSAAFPISSPQLLQAVSPQLSQHSSPQIDQQNLLSTLPKAGTPLQSANSPFIATPTTPAAPSLIPGDSEKQPPAISSISSAGNIGHQQTTHGLTQALSLAIATPGISASPLLEPFSLDGNQGTAPTNISGKTSATEQPLERLIKAVRSISPKAFASSVSDIGSVVSMIDRIAGSAPGNGSRAAVGEDLVAMTRCRLQARNFMSHDGSAATKKMRRHTSATPLNAVSSVGSVNDSFKQSSLETSELESTATSKIKRQRAETNHTLLEEVRGINQRLIVTVVEISDEDIDSIAAAAEGEGTVVKCSFNAVALSPNLKSQYALAQMSPILPLRLLVPPNYPSCSPILLDKLPIEPSKESEDLSVKAKMTFNISLRSLPQPISLGEMASTWDVCARKVISEYAQQSGGGCFSSRYGTWKSCVSA